MNKKQIVLITIVVSFLSAFSGYYFQQLTRVDQVEDERSSANRSPTPEEVIGDSVADFSLMDVDGEKIMVQTQHQDGDDAFVKFARDALKLGKDLSKENTFLGRPKTHG